MEDQKKVELAEKTKKFRRVIKKYKKLPSIRELERRAKVPPTTIQGILRKDFNLTERTLDLINVLNEVIKELKEVIAVNK